MSTPDPTLAAAARLEESMNDLGGEIGALRDYGRRNRRFIWGLVVSLLLDAVLSIVLAFVAVQASNANTVAQQNTQSAKAACEAGNQARIVSAQLWTYVLNASATNPDSQTPAKKAQIEQFRAYLNQAYAPRDCGK